MWVSGATKQEWEDRARGLGKKEGRGRKWLEAVDEQEAKAVERGGIVFGGVRWGQRKGLAWEGRDSEEKKVGWGGIERIEAWLGWNGWKSLCIITSQLSPGSEIHLVFHAAHDSFHKRGWATFVACLLYYLGCSGPHDGFIPSHNPQKCYCDASWQNFFAVNKL